MRNPGLALLVAGVLSTVGCGSGYYGEDRWVTEEAPTEVRAHSGALGTALVVCLWQQPHVEQLKGYDLLWAQIKLARGRVGKAAEKEEAAQLCTTAAALMSCQDGVDWKSLYDLQEKYGASGTCERIIEAVDARRNDTWATALAKTVPEKVEEK